MKIVVTGALGHIGSRLVRELAGFGKNPEIVMIDDFSVQRYPSLFNLPDGVRYRFIEADVTKLELAPVVAGAEAVVHLAAITNAAGSFEIKEKLEYNNFTATQKVAEACAHAKVPMFYVSTTSVYGTQASRVDENCTESELQPQSPYAETKLREEKLLESMGKEKGLRFITCRFGTIFGTSVGMRFHTAVNKFCWQSVMGQPISVWRTALDQVRPYLDLSDAVRAVRFVIERKHFDNQIYNVLTLNATVRQIVDEIRMHVPSTKIEYVDAKIMNQLSYEVACDKFTRLGFEFRGDFKAAIADTIGLLKNSNLQS
ncbi:MAG: NAD-dependent epimerase/dehydratase family protein [Bdellovibrionota bacterium]